MRIKFSDLNKIIDIFQLNISVYLGDSINIETEEFYWAVPMDDLYNFSCEPKELYLNQLSHDWEYLLRLTKKENIRFLRIW